MVLLSNLWGRKEINSLLPSTMGTMEAEGSPEQAEKVPRRPVTETSSEVHRTEGGNPPAGLSVLPPCTVGACGRALAGECCL